MAGRRAPSAPRAPHRGRSQHFLRSPALAEAIVRDARIPSGCTVVDIGAGSGRLTAPLALSAARVYAIEVDAAWAEQLRRRFAGRSNVTVVEGDALHVSLPDGPFRVVANLPFDGATAILRRLLAEPRLEQADVVLEWEAARKRAVCWPSTLLGVCWGVQYEFLLARRLPAACFEPRPAVDAGVLRIVRRTTPLVRDPEYARFCALVRSAFAERGRPARDAFRGLASPLRFKRAARGLGIDAAAPARQLDAHQWASLFAALRGDR